MPCRKIEVDEFSCERCDHVWLVRPGGKPAARCPKCKSPYWNSERKLASGPKKKGISIRAKAPTPPAPKKPAPKKAVKAVAPAVPAPPAAPAAHREVSRHCKADAHAGCRAPDCGCSCHKE